MTRIISDLGGTLQSDFRLKPASTAGAPTSGAYKIGTLHMDAAGALWRCTASGSPGTWEVLYSSTGVEYRVDSYGAVGDGVTDDTSAVNNCIAAAPAGAVVAFTPGKTYYLRSLNDITKSLTIDGKGAKITCDVTNSGASGTPLFPFQGGVTATYTASTVTIGSSTVTLSVGGTGSNFAVGDVIRIDGSTHQPQWWDGAPGPMAAQSLYQVIAVAGDVLTISPPAHMLYTGTVTAVKLNLIAAPTIRNFSNISEVYAGSAGSVVTPSPDIVSFRYCRNATVENVIIDGFGCEAVKMLYVYGGSILSVTAKNAFNPQVGGIGNLCQISYSRYVTTRNCIGYNVRHGIDYDVSQDCVSYGNVGSSSTNDVTASIYTTHGSGCCRITSVADSAEGESGWWVGRAIQSVDTDITIIGFKFVATPTAYSAVIVTGGSSRVNISNCNIRYAGPYSGGVAAIRFENGAKDITVDNCIIDLSLVSGTPTGTPAINVITNVISTITYYCSGITVRNCLMSVPSGQIAMQLEGTGAFDIRGCIVSSGIGIYGFNGSVPQSITIANNRFNLLGTPLSAIRLGSGGATSGPTDALNIYDNQITGNFSSSAILAYMSAGTPATGIRVTGNSSVASGTLISTVSGTLSDLVDNGARIEWNSSVDVQRLNSDVRVYGAAGTARGFSIYSGTSLRAKLGLTNATESGSNVGSDFAVSTYDDTGVLVDTPFTIERKSAGFIRFPRANTLFGSSTTANVFFEVRAQVNTLSTFQFSAGSIARWAIRKDNNTESGSDVGANFNIVAYSDTGSQIDTPFVINRQLSGAIYLQRTQLVVSGSTATSATVDIRTAAGSAGQVQLCSAALGRWRLMKNNVAETGSDVGSDFEIKASTDAGVTIDSPLYITRAAQGAFKVARPVTIIPSAATTGSPYALRVTVPAHTTLTAAEAISVDLLLGATVQFSTGNFGTQRAVRIQAPTYAFVAASTITTASTVSIAGAPIAGTNATFTNAYALNIESGDINVATGNLRIGTDPGGSERLRIGGGWRTNANCIIAPATTDPTLSLTRSGGANVNLFSTTSAGYVSVTTAHGLVLRTNDTDKVFVSSGGDVVLNAAGSALATSAAAGFTYLPSMAGTPSGSPGAYTGSVPAVIDTTASKLWVLFGATWKSVALV